MIRACVGFGLLMDPEGRKKTTDSRKFVRNEKKNKKLITFDYGLLE